MFSAAKFLPSAVYQWIRAESMMSKAVEQYSIFCLMHCFEACHCSCTCALNTCVQHRCCAEVNIMIGRALRLSMLASWLDIQSAQLKTYMAVQGKVVRGEGKPEATAFWIHSRLHLKHPLAGCVAHTHQPWATALCCLQDMECVTL